MMIPADMSGEDPEGQVQEEGRGLKTCGVWKHVFKQMFWDVQDVHVRRS